jgi:hypothetical protein
MFKQAIRDGSLLYLGLILLVALSIAFLLPVTPEDYWWYLRLGKEILTNGQIARVDTFTWTASGQPIFYHSWASAVIFWLAYHLGGLSLTVLLRGWVIGASFGGLWFIARRLGAGKWSASLAVLAAILAASNNWAVRPQLLVYPLFVGALAVLYCWQGGAKRIVFWLPLLALLWGNLHASFVLLFALMVAALVFGQGERKTLALAFVLSLGAIFINPRGAESWRYVAEMLSSSANMQFSAEWGPPVNQGWQMNLFFAWLLSFPVLAVFSPRKLTRLEWVWFFGFGALALWGTRYGIWFVLLLAVLTSQLLTGWEERLKSPSTQGNLTLNWLLPLIFVLLPLGLLPGIRESWWQQSPADTRNTPVEAAAWLQNRPELEGPLLAEMGFASYLEFALPDRPVWIDTRVQLFPVEQWERYVDITYAYEGWEQELDATGANLLMISPVRQPRLAEALKSANGWCKLYSDETALVYSRGACSKN